MCTPRSGRKGAITRDGEVLAEPQVRTRVLEVLQWGINRHIIDRACEDMLLLHAGAVARDGRALAITGPSTAGKSTLTAALLLRGFGYLTDEAAHITPDLTISGYAKPLTLDRGSWPLFESLRPKLDGPLAGYMDGQWQVPVQHVTEVVNESRLHAVVITGYRPDADNDLTELSPSEALAGVAQGVFVPAGRQLPGSMLQQLAGIVERVRVFRLTSGDLEWAAATVSGLLDPRPR